MGWDLTKMLFMSKYPIDKVVQTGTASVVNTGATNQAPQTALVVSGTVPNTYGKRCFVRGVYSTNGQVDWQSLDSQVTYTYTNNTVAPAPVTSNTFSGLQSAVSVGVSDTLITFRTANGLHGNVTDNGTVYTYSPISLQFDFKYALFELSS